MNSHPETFPAHSALGRRAFLALGGSTAAGAALLAPERAGAAAASGSIVYVGHALGTENEPMTPPRTGPLETLLAAHAGETAPFAPNLVSAASLPEGDPSLINTGVRVRIAGFHAPGGLAACSSLRSLLASFAGPVRTGAYFNAWSVSEAGASPSLAFDSPVDGAFGLSIRFGYSAASGSGTISRSLTPGASAGALKLRRGIYVVALRHATPSRVPQWNRWQLRAADSGNAGPKLFLFEPDGLGGIKLVDFAYIVLQIGAPAGGGAASAA